MLRRACGEVTSVFLPFSDGGRAMISSSDWAAKYRAAIFETNSSSLPHKISDAECAIVARARELFRGTGGDVDAEREELDEVLYTLRAFRNVVVNKAA